MANSIGPYQTPRSVASDLGLHFFFFSGLSEYLGYIRYNKRHSSVGSFPGKFSTKSGLTKSDVASRKHIYIILTPTFI